MTMWLRGYQIPTAQVETEPAREGLDAATVLQPESDAPGQSRKTTAQETAKTAHLCGIFRQGSTYPERFDLTYKEGVAGSNPASPTYKSPPCSNCRCQINVDMLLLFPSQSLLCSASCSKYRGAVVCFC